MGCNNHIDLGDKNITTSLLITKQGLICNTQSLITFLERADYKYSSFFVYLN